MNCSVFHSVRKVHKGRRFHFVRRILAAKIFYHSSPSKSLRALPLSGAALGDTPLRALPLSGAALGDTPLRALPLSGAALGDTPLRALPLGAGAFGGKREQKSGHESIVGSFLAWFEEVLSTYFCAEKKAHTRKNAIEICGGFLRGGQDFSAPAILAFSNKTSVFQPDLIPETDALSSFPSLEAFRLGVSSIPIAFCGSLRGLGHKSSADGPAFIENSLSLCRILAAEIFSTTSGNRASLGEYQLRSARSGPISYFLAGQEHNKILFRSFGKNIGSKIIAAEMPSHNLRQERLICRSLGFTVVSNNFFTENTPSWHEIIAAKISSHNFTGARPIYRFLLARGARLCRVPIYLRRAGAWCLSLLFLAWALRAVFSRILYKIKLFSCGTLCPNIGSFARGTGARFHRGEITPYHHSRKKHEGYF